MVIGDYTSGLETGAPRFRLRGEKNQGGGPGHFVRPRHGRKPQEEPSRPEEAESGTRTTHTARRTASPEGLASRGSLLPLALLPSLETGEGGSPEARAANSVRNSLVCWMGQWLERWMHSGDPLALRRLPVHGRVVRPCQAISERRIQLRTQEPQRWRSRSNESVNRETASLCGRPANSPSSRRTARSRSVQCQARSVPIARSAGNFVKGWFDPAHRGVDGTRSNR
jgi:hypothetical protein